MRDETEVISIHHEYKLDFWSDLTIVVEPEEDGQQDGKRNGEEDIAHSNIPEMNKPAAICCREECFACWECLDVNVFHVTKMNKPREEDDCQGSAVILNEFPHMSLEKIALA